MILFYRSEVTWSAKEEEEVEEEEDFLNEEESSTRSRQQREKLQRNLEVRHTLAGDVIAAHFC